MPLLVDVHNQDWMTHESLRAALQDLPDSQLRFYPDVGDPGAVLMLACDRLRPGLVARLPNLRLVQKLGAGVETILSDPDLGRGIRVARLCPETVAMEMARYCLAFVLDDVQNLDTHRRMQDRSVWHPVAPKKAGQLVVGVLGLGHIGVPVARLFDASGFRVMGWSRSSKAIPPVQTFSGRRGLVSMLSEADYVVCVLPATPETENLFDLKLFRRMKRTAMLINVGRGSLVVEPDLVSALDSGYVRKAVLDVCRVEPLPVSSPLWQHPAVCVTPHVSGWDIDDGLQVVSENYRRVVRDEPVLNEINRDAGY